MYKCLCYPITEDQLRDLARRASSLKELRRMTMAGMGCGTCGVDIELLKTIYEEERKNNIISFRNKDEENKADVQNQGRSDLLRK